MHSPFWPQSTSGSPVKKLLVGLLATASILTVAGGLSAYGGTAPSPPVSTPGVANDTSTTTDSPEAPPPPAPAVPAIDTSVTYAPATLMAAFTYMSGRTGLQMDAGLAIVGDAAHGNDGYHVGWDRLSKGSGHADYSVGESPRDAHPTNAAMALDIWNWDRMREFTLWLVAQCEANTADTQDIREVIYTPDGKTVRRWDRLGVRGSGDSSHLMHTHISYFRDSENSDKVEPFRRFFAERVDLGPGR